MRLQNIIARQTGRLVVTGLSVLFLLPAATSLAAQQVSVKPADVRKQLSQAAPGGSAAAPAAVPAKPKPAPKTPPKAMSMSKPSTTATPAPKTPAAAQKAAKPTSGAELKTVADQPSGPRRDPFEPLVGREKNGPASTVLPPGKAGLQIATLRLDGIVRGPNGMIAIVSNPQQRVYFLRDGDRLFDGDVEHIAMEGVSFHQSGTDPFGKPVEREVTKQLSGIPGEQK